MGEKHGIEYVRGGRCPVHELIKVPEGAPECPDHPIWLGVFEGSWHDIGRQFGESEGVRAYIAPLYDHLFGLAAKEFPVGELRKCLHGMEEHLNMYDPHFVEALKGEAEGVAGVLAKAKHSRELSDYEKVLLINFNSYSILYAPYARNDCSCITFLPSATVDGKIMVGRNTQLGRGIGNYGVAYAAVPPPPAHRFMTNTYAGMLFGLGIFSDAPLYISSTAGIGEARPGIEEAFLLAKAVIYGNTIEEATDLIIHGTEEYRKASGRKTTYRAYPTNYAIVDDERALVVESLIDRWAIRSSGDFGEKDFIITTNHQLCEYSYDENDTWTDVPMYDESICKKFGGCGTEMDIDLKDKMFAGHDTKDLKIPSPRGGMLGSWTRYWALYWSAVYNHGQVDMKMLQGTQFLGSRFWHDLNGKKVEYQQDPKTGEWIQVYYLYPHSTVEGNGGGYPEQYNNELPGSLTCMPAERTAYWQLYKPSLWEGDWEKASFK